MHKTKKLLSCLLYAGILFSGILFSGTQQIQAASASRTLIHFITIDDNNDAILVESTDSSGNTAFGMIDSGEDTDGPVSSTNGIVSQGIGYEKQVIRFLKSKGVTSDNFIFYIGTHAHSDHIGSADEIIREFKPARVYIQKYDDKYITNPAALWDNQVVYNNIIKAADEVDATIIQTFHKDAPVDPATVKIDGTIVWEDDENQGQTRPESLTLELLDNSTSAVISTCQTTMEENQWTYSFTDLPKRTDDGKMIDYQNTCSVSVKDLPDGYTVIPGSDPYTLLITLSDEPEAALFSQTFVFSVNEENTDNTYAAQKDNLPYTAPDSEDVVDPSILEEFLESRPDIETPISLRGAFSKVSPYESVNDTGAGNPSFTLGSATIEIMNYEDTLHAVPDANHNSLGVLVTSANGKTAFLSGDINNFADGYIDPATGMDTGYDESRLAKRFASTGVDVLKLGHHGFYGSNTYNYLKAMHPSIAVLTGSVNHIVDLSYSETMGGAYSNLKQMLEGNFGNPCKLYATTWYASVCNAVTISLDTVTAQVPALSNIAYSDYQQAGYYLKNGVLTATNGWVQYTVHGWIEDSDKDKRWFYFQNSPYPVTKTWMQENGNYYYLTDGGATAKHWYEVTPGEWYYFDDRGIMQTDWIDHNGHWYYCDSSGLMLTGWQYIGNSWYYLNPDNDTEAPLGSALTGWKQLEGEWYYFSDTGAMTIGWVQSGDNWYYLNDSIVAPDKKLGIMLSNGWYKIENKNQYFNADGKWIEHYITPGWRQDAGGWWYQTEDGSYPVSTFKIINGSNYYFDKNGYMVTGSQKIGNDWYLFDGNGVMLTGWVNSSYYDPVTGKWIPDHQASATWTKDKTGWWLQRADGTYPASQWEEVNGTWYYFDGRGYMKTGWLLLGRTWYYLDTSGAMKTGWLLLGNTWYYLDASGAMKTEWLLLGNTWYYLNPSGAMATGWLNLGGTWYLLSDDGAMLTDWQFHQGYWYLLDTNGAMLTGWQSKNNHWYYLYPSGAMAANTYIDSYYVDTSGAWIP
ncbi:MAG: Cna B-type domain-containing protein [Lachnospiraceae bacterium]|jgi:glucan-binding YG repeat protein/beta-lactamase superfamily II metal-dependent hydrolase